MDMQELEKNLKRRGFGFRYFETGEEAAGYIAENVQGKTVGIGGSKTIEALGLYEKLLENNEVFWHWKQKEEKPFVRAGDAQVYLTSANGIAKTGEIINIDGTGNRVASTLFGHEKVYIIAGVNKVREDYESALHRARNIASPLNARRLNMATPCASGELFCHDCSSPERICRGLVVLWENVNGVGETEVVIINESLGY